MFRCSLTILSDTRYLGVLRRWVESTSAIVGRERFPAKAVAACSLALIEAVDNAIFHAHRRKRALPIDIALTVGAGRITIDVTDRGRGISERAAPAPEALVTHGRGLFLIRELMHEVRHARERGRHRMRMTYRL